MLTGTKLTPVVTTAVRLRSPESTAVQLTSAEKNPVNGTDYIVRHLTAAAAIPTSSSAASPGTAIIPLIDSCYPSIVLLMGLANPSDRCPSCRPQDLSRFREPYRIKLTPSSTTTASIAPAGSGTSVMVTKEFGEKESTFCPPSITLLRKK